MKTRTSTRCAVIRLLDLIALIALSPHAGRKVFTLQTLPSSADDERSAARANGFSLHAGALATADQRDKLERL